MASIEEYDAIQVNNQTWNKLRVTATKVLVKLILYRESIFT